MNHHHSFRDIRHFVGQVFWTVCALFLLLMVMYLGPVLGEIGIWIRIALGSIVLLYIPGYRVTEALWTGDRLQVLEHLALSFAFSLSIVPLLVFYGNMLGMPITQYMVLGIVIVLLVVCIGRIVWSKKK